MAKRDYNWNAAKLERYIKEGRGTGEGEDYIPWIITQDYPSLGVVSRVFANKTNRIHHLFSNLQLSYFYLLEWEDMVIDIREHYPLLDLSNILENASDLNLKKYMITDIKTPYVMTTTFLITYKNSNGKITTFARSLKYSSELEKKSTQEKLEIERRYWLAKGIDWALVTNKDINMAKVKNIEYVRNYRDFKEIASLHEDAEELTLSLYSRLSENRKSIKDVISEFEKDYALARGTGIAFYKYLLANKQVTVDMEVPLNFNDYCK